MRNVPARAIKHEQFRKLVAENQWTAIHRAEWDSLRQSFSESSLRTWLAEAGIAVDQPYRGVETKSLETLESSLIAMTERYLQDAAVRKTCRQVVITAKDRTRFAARNPKVDPAKRTMKSEMVDWMLVWLGDPAMFPSWSAIRKTRTAL
jgi:hypothetical protein